MTKAKLIRIIQDELCYAYGSNCRGNDEKDLKDAKTAIESISAGK